MKIDILNINDYIEINNWKEVTTPFLIGADGNPDEEGIFSTSIFGRMGSDERKTKFGFINLKRKFLHPLIYNAIYQMFRKLPQVVNGDLWMKINSKGHLIESNSEDPDAVTGIDFFIDNWSKIVWDKDGDSKSRKKKQNLFSTMNVSEVFIDNFLVIPALYRDINLHSSAKGKIDMDEINSLYIKLINYASSESITFTSSYLTQSNLQNVLVEIHNSLTQKMSGKNGLIHSGIMGKTIDYATVSVISAPRFMANTVNEQQVPFGYIGIPLHTVCALFFPYIVKFIEDLFHDVMHSEEIAITTVRKETKGFDVIEVTDTIKETLDSEAINKLVKGFVNDKTKTSRTARFTISGNGVDLFKEREGVIGRPFTVTDLLYMAAADVTYSKNVLATRFPITDSASIIICKIKVITTEKTIDISKNREPGSFDFEYLRTYPYLPLTSKGNIDTANVSWIDTTIPNNAYLSGMGGDYDGDTFRLIGLWSNDANMEAEKIQNSPLNYVNTMGEYTRGVGRESGLALYMLTKD